MDEFIVEVKYNDFGQIESVPELDILEQSDFHSNGEDFLIHYGKKGMRWGVRTVPKRATSSSSSSKPKKSAKSMTDQELKDAVSRMQLEKQYKQLSSETSTKTRGKRATEFLLKQGGDITMSVMKQQTTNYLNNEISKAMKGKGKPLNIDEATMKTTVKKLKLEKEYRSLTGK
jgi:hypothetical protein